MRPAVHAIRLLQDYHPEYFPLPRPGHSVTVKRPPLLKAGDYLGLPWQDVITPPGVRESAVDIWLDQYWWVIDALNDRLDCVEVREQILLSIRISARQSRWLLPKVEMRRPHAYALLLAFVLYGMLACKGAKLIEIGESSLVVECRGREFGIRNNKVLGTDHPLFPFPYPRYLSGTMPWTPVVSTSPRFNATYRAVRRARDAEALLLMHSLYWNATHLQRLEALLTPTIRQQEEEKEGLEDAFALGTYW